ncbi:hypothetical protein AB4Z22_42220, partial [Paenibacillus sp. TAF58]
MAARVCAPGSGLARDLDGHEEFGCGRTGIHATQRGHIRVVATVPDAHMPVADLARAHDQAAQALERAREGDERVVSFDAISRQGVLAFLARTDAREVARSTLEPLIAADESNGSALVLSLRTWLEHNGT